MLKYIEFDFDTFDGRKLNISANTDGDQVYFKAFQNDNKISKGSLTNLDISNIESFVLDNSEEEIEYESDLYERQND